MSSLCQDPRRVSITGLYLKGINYIDSEYMNMLATILFTPPDFKLIILEVLRPVFGKRFALSPHGWLAGSPTVFLQLIMYKPCHSASQIVIALLKTRIGLNEGFWNSEDEAQNTTLSTLMNRFIAVSLAVCVRVLVHLFVSVKPYQMKRWGKLGSVSSPEFHEFGLMWKF